MDKVIDPHDSFIIDWYLSLYSKPIFNGKLDSSNIKFIIKAVKHVNTKPPFGLPPGMLEFIIESIDSVTVGFSRNILSIIEEPMHIINVAKSGGTVSEEKLRQASQKLITHAKEATQVRSYFAGYVEALTARSEGKRERKKEKLKEKAEAFTDARAYARRY